MNAVDVVRSNERPANGHCGAPKAMGAELLIQCDKRRRRSPAMQRIINGDGKLMSVRLNARGRHFDVERRS